MQEFAGRLAVVTGGGTGMGRELARQLSAEGCHVAMCDVSVANMEETQALCEADSPKGVRVSIHECDVAEEEQVRMFRDGVVEAHQAHCIHLLFNNAGIGGGGSFVAGDRDEWERTFGVCWYGVYHCARAFVPLLVASSEGYLVNTSSVNGFWASIGDRVPHTAYAAAKFAVKGFSEALINDLRVHAPHVKVAVVMPGHIGTSIALNTRAVLGQTSALEMSSREVAVIREQLVARGMPVGNTPDEHIRTAMHQRQLDFRDKAPTTAVQAANIILDGVRNDRWRILVGDDAQVLDQSVREDPESSYELDFIDRIRSRGHLAGLVDGNDADT